jgi:transcriptional regulatory protein AMDR
VRIIYIGDDASNINFLIQDRETAGEGTVHYFPLSDVLQRPSSFEVEAILKDIFILPDKPLAERLIQAYFTNVNPGCPIVEEDVFMKRYIDHNIPH